MPLRQRDASPLRSAWQELRVLFAPQRKHEQHTAWPAQSALPAPPPEAPAAPASAAEQDSDQALATFRADSGDLDSVVAGRVHLINLEPVKARLGARWESTRERIHGLVATELRTRLGRRDFFSRSRDDSYVIVFGDCSEAEAKIKVTLLTESVLAKLFGSRDAEALSSLAVRSVVASADGQLATRALGSTGALFDFLEAAQHRQAAESAAPAEAQALASQQAEIDALVTTLETQMTAGLARSGRLTVDRLHEILKHLHGLEGQFARRLDDMAGAGAGERPEIALDPGLLTSARHSLKSLRRIREQAAAQLREATGEPKEAAAPADAKARPVEPATGARSLAVPAAERLEAWQPDLEIRYRPYWHVRSRRFGIYAPEARLTLTGAAPAPYGEEDYDEELQEAVDRLVLLQGRRELEQAVNTGTAAVVAVPVHYTTLAQIGSRRRYLDLCRNIRAADRAYILWQIMGVPREAFQGQLRSFVEVLRPFGRSLSLVLTLTEQTYPHLPRDLPLVALAGVAAVGLDARRTGASEKDLIQLFDYLVKLGTETNLKPYVTGLQTSSLVIAAACAGFEYVAGPAVAEPQPRLEGIRDAPLEQIYLKTLQTGAA